MQYSDLANRLRAEGYRNTAPTNKNALVNGPEIDREVAEENPCTECNGKCRFEAWSMPGSYIAVAVCTKCGEAFEF